MSQKPNAKTPKPRAERTTTTSFVRIGNDDPRKTTPHPMDWAFRNRSEGRVKKEKSVKSVSLTEMAFPLQTIAERLILAKTGLPDRKYVVTCLKPARALTTQDVVRVCHAALQDRAIDPTARELVTMKFNTAKNVYIIEDLSAVLLDVEAIEKEISNTVEE